MCSSSKRAQRVRGKGAVVSEQVCEGSGGAQVSTGAVVEAHDARGNAIARKTQRTVERPKSGYWVLRSDSPK